MKHSDSFNSLDSFDEKLNLSDDESHSDLSSDDEEIPVRRKNSTTKDENDNDPFSGYEVDIKVTSTKKPGHVPGFYTYENNCLRNALGIQSVKKLQRLEKNLTTHTIETALIK